MLWFYILRVLVVALIVATVFLISLRKWILATALAIAITVIFPIVGIPLLLYEAFRWYQSKKI